MSGLVNKVKEALHSDKHNDHPEGTHSTQATHAGTTTTGHHTANPTTGTHTATTGYNDPEGVHGPHGTRTQNAIDPRVDSDRDHRAAGVPHAGHNTHTGHSTHTGHTDHHSATGAGAFSNTGNTAYGTGVGAGGAGVTGYNDPEGTHGPHSGRVQNAVDPRVDSDRDHRGAGVGAGGVGAGGVGGAGIGGTGVSGYNDPAGTHGPHSGRVQNAVDPRVDSDRDHRGAPGAAGTAHIGSGPGPATNTAGPHKQDLLNKADPRVDSDLDGSKTFGGNKTLSSGATTGRDPTDAAQAPPSVLRQHVGDPSIEHGDHAHGRSERHASLSHQDAHRGL